MSYLLSYIIVTAWGSGSGLFAMPVKELKGKRKKRLQREQQGKISDAADRSNRPVKKDIH